MGLIPGYQDNEWFLLHLIVKKTKSKRKYKINVQKIG